MGKPSKRKCAGKVGKKPLWVLASFSFEILLKSLEIFDQVTLLKSPVMIVGISDLFIIRATLSSSASFCFEVAFSVGLGGGGWMHQNLNS